MHERRAVSTSCSDESPESESRLVVSGVPSSIYRPGFAYEIAGFSDVGSHVCDHWHNLVPGPGVACLGFQRTVTHKRNDSTIGQWNRPCAVRFLGIRLARAKG